MSSRLFVESRVPSGSYLLGDPQDILDEWEWTQFAYGHPLHEMSNGVQVDGTTVVAFETRTGSGVYATNVPGLKIPTDSGLIGLVEMPPIDMEHYAPDAGSIERLGANVFSLDRGPGRQSRIIVCFDPEARCRQYDDGTLVFGDVTVTT